MNRTKIFNAAIALLLAGMLPLTTGAAPIEYLIHISVDGLRSDAVTTLGPSGAPNFYRLRNEGAFTDNARTDVDQTFTLPNHTTQLTGRGVDGASGHNYTANVFPPPSLTIHNNKGEYVNSVFNVAHDNGLSTGLYASKDKFVIFDQSYGAQIDSYLFNANSASLASDYLAVMTSNPFQYSMLHLLDPDPAGHSTTWNLNPGSSYLNAVASIDETLGDVLNTIESDATLFGNTAIILTSDHGGQLGTFSHTDATSSENYTIPFYVWGPDIAAGVDLYSLNLLSRADPGMAQTAYTDPNQPIRNGDAANLALDLLGLGAVPGSTQNSLQDLNVAAVPLPATLPLMLSGLGGFGFWLRQRRKSRRW